MIPAIVVFLYLAAVLYIGIFAFRHARGKEEAEDYRKDLVRQFPTGLYVIRDIIEVNPVANR